MDLIHIIYMKQLDWSSQIGLTDFSANINPFGPPASVKEHWGKFLQGIETYPDPHSTLLKQKLAHREGIDRNANFNWKRRL